MGWPVPKVLHITDELTKNLDRICLMKASTVDALDRGAKIISQALAVREKMLEEAEAKSNDLIEQAQQRHAEGFNAGVVEGKTQALQEGVSWLTDIASMKEAVISELKSTILTTVENIFSQQFKIHATNILTNQLGSVLEVFEAQETITLHVSAENEIIIKDWLNDQKHLDMHVNILVDEQLTESDFQVKNRFFSTTFSLASFKDDMMGILKEVFDQIKARGINTEENDDLCAESEGACLEESIVG